MLDLTRTKSYLQVDFEDDDDFINLLVNASYIYLQNCTGKDFSQINNSLADLFCLALIKECYDNRDLTVVKAGDKLRHVMQSILIQLTYN
ncbi:phage gp6-like head-tail connector protein [Clostridium perfringens]|nr:phage gp6-like head-tail connector protein [Clostridium perfringens]